MEQGYLFALSSTSLYTFEWFYFKTIKTKVVLKLTLLCGDNLKLHLPIKDFTIFIYKYSIILFIGRGGWTLPVTELEFPEGLDRYKWFAVFFLDGSICPKLKKYVKTLLSTPQTMVKSWSA